ELGFQLAAIVSLTMVAVIVMGSMIGVLLPFLLTRLRLDPATASAPLITSVADIGGILIYFSIANAILGLSAP
ncbi:MAG TPA: magnesium transporter, partial [Wenzhouxiangella sp.]|nr:magnesium transporter [Wenzhouxiangella sp.]